MERTQFKTFNIDRLKLIAIEAVEQSNQISIPQINVPIHFEDFIKKNNESIIACCISEAASKISEVLSDQNLIVKGVLIGPEGDFSDKEIKLIEENNMIIPISLGNSVLKSETACIVASSLIKELSNHA
jgi:16S rRNA (uracil1498-N3)-methyltransferase